MVILEEETYKKWGYYPKNLKSKSNKRILAACDECGKIREIQKEAYRALCSSCSRRGERNPNFGGNFSKAHRENLSKAHMGKNKEKDNYMFGKHLPEATKAKIREARKHQSFPKHHSKPERIFEDICKKNNLDMVEYTGNSKIWIGNINPDFIINHGKRVAIFINGDYWHSPFLRPDMRESQYPSYQIKICKRHRWIPLILWERDITCPDAESFILSQFKRVLK